MRLTTNDLALTEETLSRQPKLTTNHDLIELHKYKFGSKSIDYKIYKK
jgi:hypothetical protein